jgi:hypothetical protein
MALWILIRQHCNGQLAPEYTFDLLAPEYIFGPPYPEYTFGLLAPEYISNQGISVGVKNPG